MIYVMMNEFIFLIMMKKVVIVCLQDILEVVKDIFFFKYVYYILVVEGYILVGIIIFFDFVCFGCCQDEYKQVKVLEVMMIKVVIFGLNDKIGVVVEVFLENLFYGLFIVNEDKDLVGIIMIYDVLKYEFYKEYLNYKIYWELVQNRALF